MATAISKTDDNYGCDYLDRTTEQSQGDYYYSIAYYYALGQDKGWKLADPFAAAFVRHVRRQVQDGSYEWSVVDYYPEWMDNNA